MSAMIRDYFLQVDIYLKQEMGGQEQRLLRIKQFKPKKGHNNEHDILIAMISSKRNKKIDR